MDKSQSEKLNQSRNYLVVKSNDLVLQTRYNYTVYEQRTLAYVCSLIKPLAAPLNGYVLDYEFDILEYARICGIEKNGNLYHRVKKVLKKLSDNSMWLKLPNGSETLVRWISKVTLNDTNNSIHIKLDEDLAPYLFALQARYLSYGLKNILCMKSQFSIRLYEIFRAYLGLQSAASDSRPRMKRINDPIPYEWIIDINELKQRLMVDTIHSYSDNGVFKQKVLTPAYKEINELSDISFEFEMLKKGRSCYAVKFTITYKDIKERSKTELKLYDLLS